MKRFRKRKKTTSQKSGSEGTTFFPSVQTKLNIGKADDAYEKEADSVAEKVVNKNNDSQAINRSGEEEEAVMSKPLADGISSLQKKEQAKEEQEEVAQAKFEGNSTVNSLEGNISEEQSNGEAMDPTIRREMESGFGSNFKGVKIHTSSKANDMANSIGAQAFTHGQHIYFNQGKYDPGSKQGKKLLAHELTHTIQQSNSVQRYVMDDYSSNLEASRFKGDYLLEQVHDHAKLIKQGSKGPSVSKLQLGLMHLGFSLPVYGADGDFGNETKHAVLSFQDHYDLGIDGIIGSETMGALDDLFSGKGLKNNNSCVDTVPFSGTFFNVLPVKFFSTKDCPNITITFKHKANIHGFQSCAEFGANIDNVVFSKPIQTTDKFQKTTLKFKMKNAVKHSLNFTMFPDCAGLSITIKDGILKRH